MVRVSSAFVTWIMETMRVSVCRPSESAKRRVLDLTRDEGGLGKTQEVFSESEEARPSSTKNFELALSLACQWR